MEIKKIFFLTLLLAFMFTTKPMCIKFIFHGEGAFSCEENGRLHVHSCTNNVLCPRLTSTIPTILTTAKPHFFVNIYLY